jgi:hypothetical protein
MTIEYAFFISLGIVMIWYWCDKYKAKKRTKEITKHLFVGYFSRKH